MKRFITIILTVTMIISITSFAYAEEILFRNLTWGCNPDEFKKSLESNNVYTEDHTQLPRWEDIKKDQYIDSVNMMLYIWNANPTGHIINLYGLQDTGIKVSSYNVSFVEGYFRYGISDDGHVLEDLSDSELYLAKYEIEASNKAEAYDDLKSKLIQLYGTGNEVADNYSGTLYSSDGTRSDLDSGITRYFIQGSNNAWVLLEKKTDNGECTTLLLIYADGDADAKLDLVVEAQANQEKLNGVGNFDGL